MALSTPVLAALMGSIVAGIISGIINLLSLVIQYILNQKSRKSMKRFQWRRETTSAIRDLRRTAMTMDMDGEDIEMINDLFTNIQSQLTWIPPKYQNSDLSSRLDSLMVVNHDFTEDSEDSTLPDYRRDILDETEDALDKFKEYSKADTNFY